jgi:hypothetical protein
MADTPTQELIDNLRQSLQFWKALALTFLAGLGLMMVLGIGTTTVLTYRARQQAEAARDAEMEARMQAEQVRPKAEEALRRAQ